MPSGGARVRRSARSPPAWDPSTVSPCLLAVHSQRDLKRVERKRVWLAAALATCDTLAGSLDQVQGLAFRVK
eukprot:216830-Rhodomonas_salina.1